MRIRPMPQPRPVFVLHRHFLRQRMAKRLRIILHQPHVAVGAARKPLPVLRFAWWTIHSAPSLLHLEHPAGPAAGINLTAAPTASLSPPIYLQLYIDKYGTYMPTFCLRVTRHSHRSAPCSRLPTSSPVTKSPVVHPLSIQKVTKCFSRNSLF
jgi:hypothetical protein